MLDGKDPQAGDNSEIEIDFDELEGVIKRLASMASGVSEANGQLRSEINQVIEGRGWHKTGLAMIRQIEAMSPTKRQDFLRTFEPMFEAYMKNIWRDEAQGDFLDQD